MLSDRFVSYMLSRNIESGGLTRPAFQFERETLARTLLLLARYGKEPQPQQVFQIIAGDAAE